MSDRLALLDRKAYWVREQVLSMCVRAGAGHVTSSYSCIEILVALYYGGVLRVDPRRPRWEDRDRLVMCKAQASPALYAILADRGFFPRRELQRFARQGGKFGVHLQNDVPGVEITSGSLGQGLGYAAGMALAAKMDKSLHLVFTVLGDGECYEGSIWESAMFAAHNRLNNLVAIMDRNYLCVTDFTEDLIALEPLEEKWRAFGWRTIRVNGHSCAELLRALADVRSRRFSAPLIIIADTVKGEGVESLINIPVWHGIPPDKGKDARRCFRELRRRYRR